MKDKKATPIWLEEFDKLYDFHITNWNQKHVNEHKRKIIKAIEDEKKSSSN